jgi:hypothetical protein
MGAEWVVAFTAPEGEGVPAAAVVVAFAAVEEIEEAAAGVDARWFGPDLSIPEEARLVVQIRSDSR